MSAAKKKAKDRADVRDLSIALATARKDVEKIEAVVSAIDACGLTYCHLQSMFNEDLSAARAHLANVEASMIAATKPKDRP